VLSAFECSCGQSLCEPRIALRKAIAQGLRPFRSRDPRLPTPDRRTWQFHAPEREMRVLCRTDAFGERAVVEIAGRRSRTIHSVALAECSCQTSSCDGRRWLDAAQSYGLEPFTPQGRTYVLKSRRDNLATWAAPYGMRRPSPRAVVGVRSHGEVWLEYGADQGHRGSRTTTVFVSRGQASCGERAPCFHTQLAATWREDVS
jgi:hypothetical protein